MTTPINSKLLDGHRHYIWPPTQESFSSVTTNLGALNKPFLVAWASKMAAEYAVTHWNELDQIIREGNPEEATKLIKGAHARYRDIAAGTGTIAHDCLEQIGWLRQLGEKYSPALVADGAVAKYIKDNKDVEGKITVDDVIPFIEAFEQFCEDFKPRWIRSESTVYSRKYGYAGTFDFIAEITLPGSVYISMLDCPEIADAIDENDFYRVIVLGDFKTGNNIYPETGMQLAAYRYGDFIGHQDESTLQWIEAPIPEVIGGVILHVRPHKYKLVPVRCDLEVFDYFLSLTTMHQWQTRVSKSALGKVLEAPPPLLTLG
jgi:hypothetical protein